MKRIALLVLVSLSALAAEAPRQATRVTSAIVFKNGLALVTREGNIPFVDGRATITPLPDAYLGTLWITANGKPLDELHTSNEAYDTTRNAASLSDLIEANAGKVATLRIGDRDYSGTLLAAEPAPPVVTGAPDVIGVAAAETALVLMNVDGRVHAFPRRDVQSVSFAATPQMTTRVHESRASLALQSKGVEGTVPVTMSYLRGGVTWMPEYSIALGDDARARITMQATLLDDAEELRDTHVRFAVGYPNFPFSGVPSPLTPAQSVQQLVDRLSAGRFDPANVMVNSNLMTQNVVSLGRSSSDAFLPRMPAMGEASEDLFFYERAGVTIGAGERASFPILAMSVPFRHVYEWNVAEETEGTREGEASKPGEVWHSVALTNDGTTPWTTGPAFVSANGKPLAQDTLSYTAAGASGRVKLTIATDISVAREERETGRKRNAFVREYDGTHWTELSIEGTLTVRNYKREAITLSIDKLLEGETLTSAPAATITKRAVSPRSMNPKQRLEWDVPLAPGETKTVRYTYKLYVGD